MTLWNPPKRFPLSGSDGGACATGVAGHLVASSGHKTLLGWADPELVALKVPVEIQIIPLQLSVELLPFLNCSIASPRESLWKITWFLTVSTTQGEYQPWGCLLRLWASLHFFPGPPGWGGLVLFSVPIQKKDQFTGLFKATLALLKWTSFWRQKKKKTAPGSCQFHEACGWLLSRALLSTFQSWPEASGDPGLNSGPHAGTHLVLRGASPLCSSEHFSPKQPVKKMRKNPRSRLCPSGSSNWWLPAAPSVFPLFLELLHEYWSDHSYEETFADCKPRPRWLLSRIKWIGPGKFWNWMR